MPYLLKVAIERCCVLVAHASQQTFAQSLSTCLSSGRGKKRRKHLHRSHLLKSPGQRTGFNFGSCPRTPVIAKFLTRPLKGCWHRAKLSAALFLQSHSKVTLPNVQNFSIIKYFNAMHEPEIIIELIYLVRIFLRQEWISDKMVKTLTIKNKIWRQSSSN